MKKISRIMIVIIMLTIAMCVPAKANSYFYVIDNYVVHVVVQDDGILQVEETITVNFKHEKHGIYREIPLSGKFKLKAEGINSVESFNCDVYNINVEGHIFEDYREGNNYIIKMSNPKVEVTGVQEYRFSYTLNINNSKNDKIDWLYFNLIGPSWDTTIYDGHFTIEMPKEFDAEKINVFSGFVGTKTNIYSEYYV